MVARFSTLVGALLILALVASDRVVAQVPSQGPWPLVDVTVDGARRYRDADVVRLTKLVAGQTVSLSDLQTLANDLMETGLFRRLGFSYAVTPDGGLRLTLRLEEPSWTVPLSFDNVIWMSDEDLSAALTERVPGFDGTVVEGGTANGFIAQAAEEILAERGISSQIDLEPRLDLRTAASSYALVVRQAPVSLEVCSIAFPGASVLAADALDDMAEPLIAHPYSKAALRDLISQTLQPEYRARGYWRVAFGAADARPADRCKGLDVTVPVDEGDSYDLAAVRWAGATVFGEAELNSTLDLRVGATADGRRLSSGLAALEQEYQARGYLAVATGVTAEFADELRQVTFVIQVREGPQFRMGTLSVEGLTERQTSDLRRRWRLAPGDIFDGPFYQRFRRDEATRIGGGLRGEAQLDHENATVNVTFSISQ